MTGKVALENVKVTVLGQGFVVPVAKHVLGFREAIPVPVDPQTMGTAWGGVAVTTPVDAPEGQLLSASPPNSQSPGRASEERFSSPEVFDSESPNWTKQFESNVTSQGGTIAFP